MAISLYLEHVETRETKALMLSNSLNHTETEICNVQFEQGVNNDISVDCGDHDPCVAVEWRGSSNKW